MTAAGSIALAITVFGAFCYATAAILQAVAARRTTSTMKAMGHPFYLAGIGFDMMAWIGSIIALRELAVYVVESILAGSLAVTVVAARFILKSRMRGRDVAAVVASLAALTVLALSAGEQHDVVATTGLRVAFCAAAVGAALIGWGATRTGSAGLCAAVGGLCLGGAALTGRALPAAPMDIVTDPLLAALLMFAVTGMMMYAHALGIGQVGPVTAVHWTAEVVAPSAVALLLLGDAIRPGWQIPALVAGLVTVAAAVLLATAPATSATHEPQATPELPAAPAPAPAAAAPARPAPQRGRERVIWWGPPPIWIPAARTPAALAAPPVRELGWSPPSTQPPWAEPRRPDADRDEVPLPELVMPRRPAPEAAGAPPPGPAPAGRRPAPWHDL
ncbi:hypothetical protein ACFQFC_06965 [Amorphoplanes digitatis]|uniref:Integral membrane protein n=1 Tax=Actinoplanes digitatis TaxID=1868 RepID=A0A7W7MRT9_9ACTN|nr:hypothetical protein [Actinoplanes digitatis]MBB4763940.1 hypothetical protein [Actinoplanes digitatis]BFE73231.1 hypothetical protein GCM10020092_065320 [Actinoplanes digitatis]GID93759.1 hypothetical protein Adi01nite_31710 [Actinoplanes digitatis]